MSEIQPSKKHLASAFLGYIFFLIPVFFTARSDSFSWFHIRQSFMIFLASIGIFLFDFLLGFYLISVVLYIALLAIWCIGICNVFLKKELPVPIIGKYAERLNFYR